MSPISPTNTYSGLPADQHAFILQQIEDAIVTADLEFNVRSVNAAAEQFFHIEAENAIGKRMAELVQFEYSDSEPLESIKATLGATGRWQGELPFLSKTGRRLYFSFTLSFLPGPDGKPAGILVVGRDRTAEREAEQELQRKERFYHGLIADSLDGLLLTDVQGRIIFASPSISHVLGFGFEEVLGRNVFEFAHPDDRNYAMDAFGREVMGTQVNRFISIRLRTNTDNWKWCMVRGHNLTANPAVNGVAIYFHDDTDRRSATDALLASEQRFRMLVRNIQLGVLMFNPEGRIELANEAACEMLGVSESELVGTDRPKPEWGALCEDGTPIQLTELPTYKVAKTGKPVRNFVMGHIQPHTGRKVWLLVSADPVFNEAGELQYIISSFADISLRKQLEERLLAEQIAHQRQLTQATIDSSEKERTEIGKELHDNIGQQLTTIKLYLDLAKSTADEETLEMVGLANRNISDVINEIRSLCRTLIPSTLGDLGLEESVNDLVHTITRTQQLRIRFLTESFDEEQVPDNQKLMLFRILQEQLNNIVKHAGARRVDIRLWQREGLLALQVTDDGKGFDPATVRRGLGLTNMRNRAEMFGGVVEVRSSPGNGCTLLVTLPSAEEAKEQ